jgi:hypothetical protein
MNLPMAILALLCALIGIWPAIILRPVLSAGAAWLGTPVEAAPIMANLRALVPPYAAFGLVIFALATAQAIYFRRMVQRPGTWDCGYATPTPRMQYSSSFGAWISGLLPPFLAPLAEVANPRGPFPAAASFETHAPDPFETRVYEPLVVRLAQRFERVRWLQQGRLTLYLVYIFLTTVAALVWALVRPHLP